MADPAQLVADALRHQAKEIYVVPEIDGTRVRLLGERGQTDLPRLAARDGQNLIDRLKEMCHMPVARDRDLTGETLMFAHGERVRVKVHTAPYREQFERAHIRILRRNPEPLKS